MKVKNKDFVEIDYIGKVKDTDMIFDLTDEKLAKEKGIHQKGADYGPRVICVGRSHILEALDKNLIDKEVNQEFEVNLTPEQGFGKKHTELIRTISTQQLLNQKIQPYPGLQIQIAGRVGVIRSVTRGRTMVDFNNQLAGRFLNYKIKVLSIVKDEEKIINGMVKTLLGTKDYSIEKKEDKFIIKTKVTKQIQEEFIEELKETLPNSKISFA